LCDIIQEEIEGLPRFKRRLYAKEVKGLKDLKEKILNIKSRIFSGRDVEADEINAISYTLGSLQNFIRGYSTSAEGGKSRKIKRTTKKQRNNKRKTTKKQRNNKRKTTKKQ